MPISHALITLLLLLHISSPSAAAAEYPTDCTMCSGCNNPCGQTYSPPPPSQQSTGGSSYYYPPPQQQRPPSQTQPAYYFPPPAPPKYSSYFPGPPPPNPIVPYFPFFYHSPPNAMPSSVSRSTRSLPAAVAGALLIFLLL